MARASLALAGLLVSAASAALVAPSPVRADAAGAGGDFVPLVSTTVLDTRNGIGGITGVRGPGSTTTFQVLGRGGVPDIDVSAVLVDVTTVSPTGNTNLVIWPDGSPRPDTSNLNVIPGNTLSNTSVVPVGASGKLNVFNNTGTTHLVVDVHGYFSSIQSDASGRGGFVPVAQRRLVDTRIGLGAPKAKLASGATLSVTVGDGSSVPADALAAFLNLTVTDSAGSGYLRLYPSGGTSGSSTMDYLAGSTAVGTAIKLGTGGKINIFNAGAPLSLVIDVEGYFSAQPTQGAGLRTLAPVRVFNTSATGNKIPAGGTVDLAIGGRYGLPTRNIAGAVLNLTAARPTAGGYLKAWPKGDAEPETSLSDFPVSASRAGLAVVRPGVEGKITIRNASSAALDLLVDLQGWFADPLPPAPAAHNARLSAMQLTPPAGATLGAIEYSFVDDLGRLRYGHQASPNQFGSVEWSTLPGGNGFTGQPAISQLSDGRVQVAAQDRTSNLRSIAQTAVGGPAWNAWADLGGSMASSPVAAQLPDGTTVLFAVDADGRLWDFRQTGTSPSWRSLGDADLTAGFGATPLGNGLRIVAVDTAGAVKTATYFTSGTLSAWTSLGGDGFTGTPALVSYPGFLTGITVRGNDGVLRSKRQDLNGVFPADWSPMGDLVTVGSPAAILDPLYGRTVLVARGTDDTLSFVWETAQASNTWGTWTGLGSGPVVTDPSITPFTMSSGESWLIVSRNVNNLVLYSLRNEPPGATASAAGRSTTKDSPFINGSLPPLPAGD